MEYKNQIIVEDALKGLKKLPDNCVDCSISSPPYWGLRDYNVEGQLGQEEDFKDYIGRLVEIYKEIYRVLKPTGTCFVNLGDTYGTGSGGDSYAGEKQKTNKGSLIQRKLINNFNKSLLMIPERFAIEMISSGWILRNQIIWHKRNQMPSSASDRFTVDFEKVFFFVKQSKYYFEQQFEPVSEVSLKRAEYGWHGNLMKNGKGTAGIPHTDKMGTRFVNPDGRNMRTVWDINTESFKGAHFAVYPQKLVRRMIKSGCPENGIVLDPFMGAGTTAVVARKLKRNYVGFELNPEYKKLAEERLMNEIGLFL